MSLRRLFFAATTVIALAASAVAQGDLTVLRIAEEGNNPSAILYYGQANGLAAYSFATQACNAGNADLTWTSTNGMSHPVVSQNMFRLKDGRFEQLGQSWLKHGFCALCESGCGFGGGIGCGPALSPGCADTYNSSLNDGSAGGPKYMVNPTMGDHLHPDPLPVGHTTLRGRLQVEVAAIDPVANVGAEYFIEGMYVHYGDSQANKSGNNATWRQVDVQANLTLTGAGPSIVGETAAFAWKNADSGVVVQEVANTDEGGAGRHGYMQVASRVHDNGNGTWKYVYFVYNQNSTQGVYSLSVPYIGGATLSNWFFNDVDYHSGELQDLTDWSHAEVAGAIVWTCPQAYAQNVNANAINWGTGYTFGFDADIAPGPGVGELALFEPGVGNVLLLPLDGPGGVATVGTAFCFGDGSGTPCPCGNTGASDAGCLNSSGSGSKLAALGNPSVGTDTLVLKATNAAHSVTGLFFSGTAQANSGAGSAFGDGLLCATGQITRLDIVPTSMAGAATSFSVISSIDGALAGQTRYYQYWYRDTNGSPCGTAFNTSQALAIAWQL